MIAALLALVAAVSLTVGYLADVTALGYAAIGFGVAAVVALLVPAPERQAAEVLPPVEEAAPATDEDVVPEPAVAVVPKIEPVADIDEPAWAPGDLVLVSPGRRRYHRPGCELLADLEVEQLTEDEARDEGFTRCTRCAWNTGTKTG